MHSRNIAEQRRAIVGSYSLRIGSDCSEEGIDYARLLLRENGTYYQEGRFKGGSFYSIDNRRWEYNRNGQIYFEGFKTNPAIKMAQTKDVADVQFSVEFSEHQALIFVSPGQNCFFAKER